MADHDIGIDLGTTKVIVATADKGVLLCEPSVVAMDIRQNTVLAVGTEAEKMVGRTPSHIVAAYPLSGGVISDYRMAQEIIRNFLGRIGEAGMVKPRVSICVPTYITGIEANALTEAALEAGARQVYLIDEPIAAAIGAGVDILEARGHLVVDIGGGTTDVAVISMGGTVVSASVKVAGNRMDEEISKYLRTKYHILIGQRMARLLKEEAGCCCRETDYYREYDVKGRSLDTGLPQRVTVTTKDLYEPLEQCMDEIYNMVHGVFERTPPELAGDILAEGILFTGGGAGLAGLADYISSRAGVPVHIARDPVNCVALGTALSFGLEGRLESGFRNVTPNRR